MKQSNRTGVSFVRAFLPVILLTLLGTLVLPFLLPGAVCVRTLSATATESSDYWYIQRVDSTILSLQASYKYGTVSFEDLLPLNDRTAL